MLNTDTVHHVTEEHALIDDVTVKSAQDHINTIKEYT